MKTERISACDALHVLDSAWVVARIRGTLSSYTWIRILLFDTSVKDVEACGGAHILAYALIRGELANTPQVP